MSNIVNLDKIDPFADAAKGDESGVQDGLVHIRIQQRNGRKTLTTIQGLSTEYDLKKIVRACKKEFACNGTVIEHPEYGEVLQLQGDQRTKICGWLTKTGLVRSDQLKVMVSKKNARPLPKNSLRKLLSCFARGRLRLR